LLFPLNPHSLLYLVEIFESIQGETSFSGLPTTFIRLAACNLRCTWCDTTYSFGRGTPWKSVDIIEHVEKLGSRHICVTGGEPLLQENVHALMQTLCDKGYIVSLETGGSLPTNEVDSRVHVILDIKCPNSRMSEKNDWSNLPHLRKQDEVKFVLMNREDYEYAKDICRKFNLYEKAGHVLFSPVHGQLNAKELVEWILADRLPARLNLQIHKYVWDPLTKGV
jgi:7-carboxy-7-deazaguanine synthase